jgi:hypothetical protein
MISKSILTSGAFLTSGLLSLQAATTWNAAADLITNENSVTDTINGIGSQVPEWSYGYTDVFASSTITLFPSAEHTNAFGGDPNIQGWRTPVSGFMITVANVSLVTSSGLAAGQMLLHPLNLSSTPTYNVVRWTAPSAGTYEISAFWTTISTATGGLNDGTDAHIVINGAFTGPGTLNTFVGPGATVNSGPNTVILASGATVDFVLGPGASGNNANDSTLFDATITLVPEPASTLLLAAATPLLLRRRRPQAK